MRCASAGRSDAIRIDENLAKLVHARRERCEAIAVLESSMDPKTHSLICTLNSYVKDFVVQHLYKL